jgi:hypothetical protein
MKPKLHDLTHRVTRRNFLALLGMSSLAGCASPLMRGQSPEDDLPTEEPEKKLEMVGDYTSPWGLNWVKLESIALVTNLDNTGSDPPPSAQRQRLMEEMQTHEIRNADQILAQPSNAMVIVRGYLPPAVQKGDIFDVEVRNPSRSETLSLRGGWLMQTRLRQMEVMGGAIRTGSVEGLAQGDVIVDAVFDGTSDKIKETRARVLGGGVSGLSRKLGLMISREESSVRISMLIGAAINARFYTYEAGVKKGAAEPQRDNFLELNVSPRYKHNLARYLRVMGQIALKENAIQRTERLRQLEKKLLEPSLAANAALQLEAIGKLGVDTLKKGLTSVDPEVRFYTAEALAYLDQAEAAEPLAAAANSESAFRWHALTALTAMDHVASYDALNELLHVKSVETRYGAFRALRTRNPKDPVTKGELLDKKFGYHVLSTTGEPLIHITRSKRPEIVLFGSDMKLQNPQFLNAGKRIMLKGLETGEIKVSRFAPGQPDAHEVCSTELDKVIRTVVRLGGGYADVIQLLNEAKKNGCLNARLAVEALATPGRKFQRTDANGAIAPPVEDGPPVEDDESEGSTDELASDRKARTPSPELFTDRLQDEANTEKRKAEITETYVDPAYQEPEKKRIIDKLNPWSGSGKANVTDSQ